MKKRRIILIIIICCFAFLLLGYVGARIYYSNSLTPVNSSSKENVTFVVEAGTPANIIAYNLMNEGLIKNDLTLKIYIKLHPGTPQAGTYTFTKDMSAIEIYEAILNGKVTRDTTWITFVEGKRLTFIAEVISKNFDYTEEEVMTVLDDKEYINELISKYDFLTEDILNSKIYHPLEGYLYPDTYEFDTNISIKGIIEKMLDNTGIKLSQFSKQIEESSLSIHEIMTLASIVELEGARSTDRDGVAGVFYNRLKSKMTLGSDVTTYYAVGKDFSVDLTKSDLSSCNGYNTRGSCVSGLPVGPIANFGFTSLKATIEPETHNYYFFVADKYGKTYFSKTNSEHESICAKLKREGLWYEY